MLGRNVYTFQRYGYDQGVTFSFAGGTGFLSGVVTCNGISTINYGPGSVAMPNVSEFTNLFDQYKVLNCTVEFRPRFSEIDGAVASTMPTIHWIYDIDDATAPGGMSDLMERTRVRSARLIRPVRLTMWRPTVASPIYQSAIATSYGPRTRPWIDVNNSSVPHYGIKWVMQGSPGTSLIFDVRVRWKFMCKNPR